MSYTAIEARLQTLLQALTRFAGHPEAVTRGDYAVLDRGLPDAIILEAGAANLPEPEQTHSGFSSWRQREWDSQINLFRRYEQDGTTSADFAVFRDEVIEVLENYPSLDTLVMAGITKVEYISAASIGEPQDVMDKLGQGPFFLMQILVARYRESRFTAPGLGH